MVQSINLKPHSDNTLSRFIGHGLNNTSPKTKTPDRKDDTNEKKAKVADPTYVVRSPARNRAVFSGNHGRRQSRIC